MPKIIRPPSGPFVLLDLETSGFDHHRHEILQVGILIGEIINHRGIIYDTYETKIIPENIEEASKKALEINKYDPEVWEAEGLPASDVFPFLVEFLDGCVFIGYNTPFDLGFLRSCIGLEGFKWVEPVRQFDVLVEIGRPLSRMKSYPNAKLDTLCAKERIDYPAHDALGDVKRTWVLMWEGYKMLTGEDVEYDIP